MKSNARPIFLTINCPTCGAKPGEKCELSTGQPRNTPHRDRRGAAQDRIFWRYGREMLATLQRVTR